MLFLIHVFRWMEVTFGDWEQNIGDRQFEKHSTKSRVDVQSQLLIISAKSEKKTCDLWNSVPSLHEIHPNRDIFFSNLKFLRESKKKKWRWWRQWDITYCENSRVKIMKFHCFGFFLSIWPVAAWFGWLDRQLKEDPYTVLLVNMQPANPEFTIKCGNSSSLFVSLILNIRYQQLKRLACNVTKILMALMLP